MRVKYQLAIGALPIGLMFAAFIPLFQFADWLESAMGLAHGAPVKSQPNGGWWIAAFLAVMVVGMVAGYFVGWLCNAVIARYLFRWPAKDVRAVFLYSKVPAHWLRDGADASTQMDASEVSANKWAEQRKVGVFRFIFTRGVLAWGGPMFLVMYLAPAWSRGESFVITVVALNVALWAVAGATFGAAIWYSSELNYRKLRAKDEP